MKKLRITVLIFSISLAHIACDKFVNASPTAPSGLNGGNSKDHNDQLSETDAWRPQGSNQGGCIVVHTPLGPAVNGQIEAMRKLRANGNLSSIRLGANYNYIGGNDYYHSAASSMGLYVMSVISADDLNSAQSWESEFERHYLLYPQTGIWQIGNEVSNPAIVRRTMSPEEYMDKFKKLYNYVNTKYPHVRLSNAPTVGSASMASGDGGPREFQRYMELGLGDMNIVISLNLYTENALYQYSSIFGQYAEKLRTKRVWVTETGEHEPRQTSWVRDMYPKIRTALHPESICWYALWEGDGENAYGLINGLERGTYHEGDLFKRLTGSTQ